MKASISKEKKYVTMIEPFTVDPKDQDQLVEIMVEAAKTLKHIPGFVSISIHKSLDGKRVTNYEQWESIKHAEAMYQNPLVGQHIKKAVEIARPDYTPLSSVLYTVEHVNSRKDKD